MPAWSEKQLEAHFAAKMRLPDGRRLVLVKACMGGIGGVDLVCLDDRANLILIEAKARRAGRKTMAQLISYIYAAENTTLEGLILQREKFANASARALHADAGTHKLFFKNIRNTSLKSDFEATFKRPLKKLGATTYAYILAPRFYSSTLEIIPWLEQHFPQTKFGAIVAKPSVERNSRLRPIPQNALKFAFRFL